MADVPVVVTDRVVQHPTRFKLTNADTGEVLGLFDLAREPGNIISEGSPLNKALLEGIQRALMEHTKKSVKRYTPNTFQKFMTGGSF